MVITEIGHFLVRVGEREHLIVPSFSNIAKIGTPKEIIEYVGVVESPQANFFPIYTKGGIKAGFEFSDSFKKAAWILECCGLPKYVTGEVISRQNEAGYVHDFIMQGKIPTHDVFVLAAHCIKHGISGVEINPDEESEPQTITEFNVNEYIVMAKEILDCSIKEASDMTMTQLINLCSAQSRLKNKKENKIDLSPEGLKADRKFMEEMDREEKLRLETYQKQQSLKSKV